MKTKMWFYRWLGPKASDIVKNVMDEHGYKASVHWKNETNDMGQHCLVITHKSNLDRIKRWKQIEKEIYERYLDKIEEENVAMGRIRAAIVMLYELRFWYRGDYNNEGFKNETDMVFDDLRKYSEDVKNDLDRFDEQVATIRNSHAL